MFHVCWRDYPLASRNGLFAGGSEEEVVVPEDQAAAKANIPQPYWGYEDIGIFLSLIAFISAVFRLAVRLHFISSSQPRPTAFFQLGIVLLLSLSLYLVLKLRHHKPVLEPLGWVRPSFRYLALAPLFGSLLASGVVVVRYQVTPPVSLTDLVLLSFIAGPILEESLFRGCLLPVFERSTGRAVAVIGTAVLFALFHAPVNAAHWFWFTATGMAYGWMRIASQSTSAAALMHASYNLALILFAR
jgi:membrane protease YdiL (CAAX protease family)